ncbi:MAG: PilZ domain-containing protein [Desulfobacteraceae bacterium]
MAEKVFVNGNNVATFVCPKCGKARRKEVSRFAGLDGEVKLKARCGCGHAYPAVLERRKQARKEVNLRGAVYDQGKRVPVKVENLSRKGLKLKLINRTEFKVGERVRVEFTLDDASASKVIRDAVVRKKCPGTAGVEFVNSEHYDKFGAYLLFHLS